MVMYMRVKCTYLFCLYFCNFILLDIETVLTMWYFLFFALYLFYHHAVHSWIHENHTGI